MIGHVVPEAATGGPIALIKTGDIVTIDLNSRTLEMDVSRSVASLGCHGDCASPVGYHISVTHASAADCMYMHMHP